MRINENRIRAGIVPWGLPVYSQVASEYPRSFALDALAIYGFFRSAKSEGPPASFDAARDELIEIPVIRAQEKGFQ